ncbi:unnamed protein product [Prorocentrum cordatum]|uniref:Uncharacterized protein n=1 Tax=Prorocentrum cordatum TaxID=2364126 RepID=A0ABN9RLU6_9DINO|nr:unnamed protein product [Polarella glacialis]
MNYSASKSKIASPNTSSTVDIVHLGNFGRSVKNSVDVHLAGAATPPPKSRRIGYPSAALSSMASPGASGHGQAATSHSADDGDPPAPPIPTPVEEDDAPFVIDGLEQSLERVMFGETVG